MPYYLYRVTQVGPVKQLEKITEFGFFKHASAEAKRLLRVIEEEARPRR